MNPPMFEQKSSQDALTTASLPTIFIIYLIHSAAIVSHTLVFEFQSNLPRLFKIYTGLRTGTPLLSDGLGVNFGGIV